MRTFLILMIVVSSMIGMAIAVLPFISPGVAAALSPAICPANERAVLNQMPSESREGGVSVTFQCLSENGKRSDVGLTPYLVIVGIALGLPLIPTLLLIAHQRTARPQPQPFPGTVTYSTVTYSTDMMTDMMKTFTQGNMPNLPIDKILEQLEQAYKAGHLTAEQYEQSRQAIIDNFGTH